MFRKLSACEINKTAGVLPQAAVRSSRAARASGQHAIKLGLDWKDLAAAKRRRSFDTWLDPLMLAWSWKSQTGASHRTGACSCLSLWDNHISPVTLSADWLVLVSVKRRGQLWSADFWRNSVIVVNFRLRKENKNTNRFFKNLTAKQNEKKRKKNRCWKIELSSPVLFLVFSVSTFIAAQGTDVTGPLTISF